MSLKNSFATNKQSETAGVWIDICENVDGTTARMRIARAGRRNKAYMKAMEKATKPYRAILDELDSKTDDRITATVLAETIVLGWENIQEEDGVNLPYTKENALRILTDLPDLADLVNKKAWDITTFRDTEVKDEVKN